MVVRRRSRNDRKFRALPTPEKNPVVPAPAGARYVRRLAQGVRDIPPRIVDLLQVRRREERYPRASGEKNGRRRLLYPAVALEVIHRAQVERASPLARDPSPGSSRPQGQVATVRYRAAVLGQCDLPVLSLTICRGTGPGADRRGLRRVHSRKPTSEPRAGSAQRQPDRSGSGVPQSAALAPVTRGSSAALQSRPASPTSRSRRLGSFSRQRRINRDTASRRRRRQRRPVGLARQHVGQHVGRIVALESAPAAQHLEENAAERPDVGALVDRLSARLLRRHVGRGAQDRRPSASPPR